MLITAGTALARQLPDRPTNDWMNNIAGDLRQRLEHESPLMHSRMRYAEGFVMQHKVRVEKNVDVDDARSPPFAARAAEFDLDGLYRSQ